MTFGAASFAYLIVLVLPLIVLLLLEQRKRKGAQALFEKNGLFAVPLQSSGLKRLRAQALLLAAFVLCIVALMRPQWGTSGEGRERPGLDILVAVDTSKSMLSRDVAPNRLDRAKSAAGDFVAAMKGERAGLLAFSGSAFLVCPLTTDYHAFLRSLDNLGTGTIPEGGTNIGEAIRESLRSLNKGRGKEKKGAPVLLLITDGEDHGGDAVEAAGEAQRAGVRIFSLSVGTPEGDLIPISLQSSPGAFLKDGKGNVVKSRMHEGLLQRIAALTGGAYARSTETESSAGRLYREHLSGGGKEERVDTKKRFLREWFQAPLALAVALLLAETLIGRRRGSNA